MRRIGHRDDGWDEVCVNGGSGNSGELHDLSQQQRTGTGTYKVKVKVKAAGTKNSENCSELLKIEGIFTSEERLKKLVLNKTMPQNRNEQELAGYRDVLNTIHENYDYIPVRATLLLRLHRDLYKFRGAGPG